MRKNLRNPDAELVCTNSSFKSRHYHCLAAWVLHQDSQQHFGKNYRSTPEMEASQLKVAQAYLGRKYGSFHLAGILHA